MPSSSYLYAPVSDEYGSRLATALSSFDRSVVNVFPAADPATARYRLELIRNGVEPWAGDCQSVVRDEKSCTGIKVGPSEAIRVESTSPLPVPGAANLLASRFIKWREADGTVVTLYGLDGSTSTELEKVANQIRGLDRAETEQLVEGRTLGSSSSPPAAFNLTPKDTSGFLSYSPGNSIQFEFVHDCRVFQAFGKNTLPGQEGADSVPSTGRAFKTTVSTIDEERDTSLEWDDSPWRWTIRFRDRPRASDPNDDSKLLRTAAESLSPTGPSEAVAWLLEAFERPKDGTTCGAGASAST
ncbi:MAG: hypothetical protein HYX32_13235 [Actinobacteria bacterium]|nr:hypothetical protein [Actinomycetota bacterium]